MNRRASARAGVGDDAIVGDVDDELDAHLPHVQRVDGEIGVRR